jgi:hypothetical protein
VVRLSALSVGRLYPPGNIPGTYFCWRPNVLCLFSLISCYIEAAFELWRFGISRNINLDQSVGIHNNYLERKWLTNNRLCYGVTQHGVLYHCPGLSGGGGKKTSVKTGGLQGEIQNLLRGRRTNLHQLHLWTYCRFLPDAAEMYLTMSTITLNFQVSLLIPGRL